MSISSAKYDGNYVESTIQTAVTAVEQSLPKLDIPYCPKCETKRADDSRFCSLCGTKLVEGVRGCPCGYGEIWPHEKFCQKCGRRAPELPAKIQQCEASVGVDAIRCEKQATQGRMCDEHYVE